MSSFVMTVVDAPTIPMFGAGATATPVPVATTPPPALPPVLPRRVALTLISGSVASCASAAQVITDPAKSVPRSARPKGVRRVACLMNKVTGVLRRFMKSRRRGLSTRRHDKARQANVAETHAILEETSHRPVLRNGYVTSPPRNTAPSHAPCDGRMTGTGRSPGSRIVTVVRLPKLCSEELAQWHDGQWLTADSCGGSSGFRHGRENAKHSPRRHRIPYWPACAGTCAVGAIKRSLLAMSMPQSIRNPVRWVWNRRVANWRKTKLPE